MAETVHAFFLARRMTLSDPATVLAMQATLDLIEYGIAGVRAQGLINDDGEAQLRAVVDGIRHVPDGS
jgi:hypothetical protein